MPNDLWVPSTEIVRPQNAWEASASFGFQFFVNCRMLQRDIIKDQIEQLGRVLAKVMGKFFGFKDAGNVQEGITVSKEELIAELDFDVEAVVKLTDEELRQFLVDRLYSAGQIDVALDFRRVMYEDTEGFEGRGWAFGDNGFPTGAVKGFGWKNMSIISAGFQYKGISKLPLRLGYTYSSNPIDEDLAFFSTPATAIIKHAYQFGLSYEINDTWRLDSVYHYGTSGDATEGQILNPGQITPSNPLGAIRHISII